MSRNDIQTWISELRDRLVRGELSGLAPIDIGYGTGSLTAKTSIRIMLSDLDDLDDLDDVDDLAEEIQRVEYLGPEGDWRWAGPLLG